MCRLPPACLCSVRQRGVRGWRGVHLHPVQLLLPVSTRLCGVRQSLPLCTVSGMVACLCTLRYCGPVGTRWPGPWPVHRLNLIPFLSNTAAVLPQVCGGHGHCLGITTGYCECNAGYTGSTCSQCAPGYVGAVHGRCAERGRGGSGLWRRLRCHLPDVGNDSARTGTGERCSVM